MCTMYKLVANRQVKHLDDIIPADSTDSMKKKNVCESGHPKANQEYRAEAPKRNTNRANALDVEHHIL